MLTARYRSLRGGDAQGAGRGVFGAAFARRAVGRDDFEAKQGDAGGEREDERERRRRSRASDRRGAV